MTALAALAFLQIGKPDLPVIATAAGITVGLTTVEAFERVHAKGKAITGGHPRGARLWYVPALRVELYADGFNFGPRGRVIDTLSVSFDVSPDGAQGLPRIALRQGELGLLGRLHAGMSTVEVTKALGTTQELGEVHMLGLVRYREKLVNKDDDRFEDWAANFVFDDGGLDEFTVWAD